jgi:competence protein ComFC
VKPFLNNILHALSGFVYPPLCIVCDMELNPQEKLVCRECWGRLEFYEGDVCHGLTNRSNIDEIRTAFVYDDAMKTIMHYLKYKKATLLGRKLAEYMVRIIGQNVYPTAHRILLPVPLHKIKHRERGYNQSEIVAVQLSRLTGIPCHSDVLVRVRNTVSQTRMEDADARARNVADIFRVNNAERLDGASVILLDDVVTTGATANAAAGKLKEAGAGNVTLLTIAHPVLKK